jgi:hypothetical protein
VDWSPSPITALAFPPSPLPPLKFAEETLPVLAIGYTNGNIELWKWTGLATSGKSSQGWVLSQASLLALGKVVSIDEKHFRLSLHLALPK